MKILFSTFSLALLAGIATAQPDSLWSRTYGGPQGEWCSEVILTNDGGYALAGITTSFGNGGHDLWLVKTDENGDSLWSRTYGRPYNDNCGSAIQTSDGGYLLVGNTRYEYQGQTDWWIVKTDINGDSLWSRTFGGYSNDMCQSVLQTSDGGYVLAGETKSINGSDDWWLIRTDINGDSLWSRVFGNADRGDNCSFVGETFAGGYMLAGGINEPLPSREMDMWLIVTDSNGDSLWSRTYGGPGGEWAYSVQQTADGGFALAGRTNSYGSGGFDVWLLITNSIGDSIWSQTFGGEEDDQCFASLYDDVARTPGTVDILSGKTQSYGPGDSDFWLIGASSTADSIWSKTFGGIAEEVCVSIKKSTDLGYLLAGDTRSFGAGDWDFWLVRTGPDPCLDQTPATPDDVILVNEGNNMRLSWSPVTTNWSNCPIDNVSAYLIWNSESPDGDYVYHGFTSDTTYIHYGVTSFQVSHFYKIEAYAGPMALISDFQTNQNVTRDKFLEMLK